MNTTSLGEANSPRLLARFSRQTSTDVFHALNWGMTWGVELVEELKEVAARSDRGRARLCFHPSTNDQHHEMLIVMSRTAIERPQRRTIGFDTKVVVEGRARLRYYSDDGEPTRAVELGGEYARYVHTCSNEFHSLLICSDWFVFLEILKGPFDSRTTEFAHWSPQVEECQ